LEAKTDCYRLGLWNCGDFFLLAIYTKLRAIGCLRTADTLRDALREALREAGRDLERALVAGWRAKSEGFGQTCGSQ
jgi:hypothetical protein